MYNRSPDDVNFTPAFQREGFGRQSMSEKRKGHVDPKSLDLYQKLKQGRDKSQFTYGRCCLTIVFIPVVWVSLCCILFQIHSQETVTDCIIISSTKTSLIIVVVHVYYAWEKRFVILTYCTFEKSVFRF